MTYNKDKTDQFEEHDTIALPRDLGIRGFLLIHFFKINNRITLLEGKN
jgi:hypothetical protein